MTTRYFFLHESTNQIKEVDNRYLIYFALPPLLVSVFIRILMNPTMLAGKSA
jgi:hypothetical protein